MDGIGQDQRGRHPLSPLSEDEVRDTVTVVRAHPEYADGSVFVYIWLREPAKSALAEYEVTGRRPTRESKVVLYDRSLRLVTEVVVSLTDAKVRSWQPVPGARPKASRRDFQAAVEAVKADPRWQEAMHARGVTDFTHVEVQPWPPGYNEERDAIHGARVAKALTWVGFSETDNTFARPAENLVATVDLDTSTVLAVDDEVVPLPPQAGNYAPELASDGTNFPVFSGPRADVKPIEITQPEGPSFTLDGHEIRWQKWHLFIGYTPREGLVLHRVRYADGGRERSILNRASLSEMWVPYGDPAPVHRVKAVFEGGVRRRGGGHRLAG
jgi:primary-amine oxidase